MPLDNANTLEDTIHLAVACIPPLWPLDSFVAVNPFLGLNTISFFKASGWVRKMRHGSIYMEPGYYLEKFREKSITEEGFQKTQSRVLMSEKEDWGNETCFSNLEELVNYLTNAPGREIARPFLSFADFVDKEYRTHWHSLFTEEISKWSSVYFDQGQSLWPMPWREDPFWNAWLQASYIDQNPEWLGLKGFRKIVRSLPLNSLDCIRGILGTLEVPEHLHLDYLQRLIVSVSGWASHGQFLARESGNQKATHRTLIDLLAVRLVFELGLFHQFPTPDPIKKLWYDDLSSHGSEPEKEKMDRYAFYLAQSILENHYQDSLISTLKVNKNSLGNPKASKTLQAIFCIDVRSEVYRSSLESESDDIETLGFAGFFGISIQYFPFGKEKGMNLCPVLIHPKINVAQGLKKEDPQSTKRALDFLKRKEILTQAWNSFKYAAISCFSFVESMGLGFLAPIVGKSFPNLLRVWGAVEKPKRLKPTFRKAEMPERGIHDSGAESVDLEEEITMAAEALKNMGLTDHFASIVLLAGHGSESVNNPYSSSLDCGACGGHSGEINAIVLASILNNPEARIGLKKFDIHIPDKTRFIAGLHNTTTDALTLFDTETVPAYLLDEIRKVKSWIRGASQKAQIKRSSLFPKTQEINKDLANVVRNNSRDWAQVRPEWGLAGNAAFIAAPRSRTQPLDLKGRVFLHNYDPDRDLDHSVLDLVMMAPMVVATWINLQYYASTVNNDLYGSGNKTIHNVVGKLGIWQGNGGDLQTGLPLQSLHDGSQWIHEPLRLSVFLEATKENIEQKIMIHPEVRNLILNHWIYIFSIDPTTSEIYRFLKENQWEKQ